MAARTFNTDRVERIHGDHHALWINPADSNHMLIGSDGGISWSWDAGRSWDFTNNLAIGQFYELGVDMRQPYVICGGMQDNNTWCGPSASMNPRGIPNSDWFTIGGGDGFYAQIDPTDPEHGLRRIAGRQSAAPRSAHGRVEEHPSAAGRGRAAVSLPVELADRHLDARSEDDLLRRQLTSSSRPIAAIRGRRSVRI